MRTEKDKLKSRFEQNTEPQLPDKSLLSLVTPV